MENQENATVSRKSALTPLLVDLHGLRPVPFLGKEGLGVVPLEVNGAKWHEMALFLSMGKPAHS